MKQMNEKIVEMFREFGKQTEYLDYNETLELVILLDKIRKQLEAGEYDTDNKKWSELNWRV